MRSPEKSLNRGRCQAPSPTYIQTSGDVPAVGQARLHAPDEYQPHPMHVRPNSPQFCKSRLNVEIQTGRFAVQPRERIIRARTTTSAAESQDTISHVLPCHATTGRVTAYSPVFAKQSRFEDPEGHWLELQPSLKHCGGGQTLERLEQLGAMAEIEGDDE